MLVKLFKYVNVFQEETINPFKMITFVRKFENVNLHIEKTQKRFR